jgi:hypothetical protein
MVDRRFVIKVASRLVEAEEEIVEGLGPITDDWLAGYHGTKQFLEKENAWRRNDSRGKESDPLRADKEGRTIWDFSVLLNTIASKRWSSFVGYLRKRKIEIEPPLFPSRNRRPTVIQQSRRNFGRPRHVIERNFTT